MSLHEYVLEVGGGGDGSDLVDFFEESGKVMEVVHDLDDGVQLIEGLLIGTLIGLVDLVPKLC